MFAGFRLKTETRLQPVLVTTARLLTSSMATPPGAAGVPLQAARGISSRTVKSVTFEPVPEPATTSRAKWRGPARMFSVPPGELGSGVDTGMVTSISLLFTKVKLPRVDEAKGTPSRRTWEPASKPVPRIFTGPTAAGATPNVILTAGARDV